MLPSLISLSGRLFLLVEIINLALSYYLMFQLFMECSCRELRFSVIAVIADLSIWYARMIFSEIAWHCWSEQPVCMDCMLSDAYLSLLFIHGCLQGYICSGLLSLLV